MLNFGFNKYGISFPRFRTLTGLDINTEYVSNTASLKKIASDAAITVPAGVFYSLDDGPFTSTAGVRGAALKIRLKVTSSDAYETSVTATVTIGGVVYSWVITTMYEASYRFMDNTVYTFQNSTVYDFQ